VSPEPALHHCRRLGPAQAPGRKGCWVTRRPMRTSWNLCGAELGLGDWPERTFRAALRKPNPMWMACPECARIFREKVKSQRKAL